MGKIQVLDCTLRDGGYVNNWEFGEKTIRDVRRALGKTGVEILELGFLRDEKYDPNRSVFRQWEQLADIIGEKEPGVLYAAIAEMSNYYPLEILGKRRPEGVDAVRYSFWGRSLDEAYDYCGRVRELGYLLCCQPTRVEQYSYEAFGQMCRRFSALEPYALYIVDTYGLLSKERLINYARAAQENLAPGIILGYHAHDNMGQAFCNACAFLEMDLGDRILQVDASIGGMGRGAGNLRLEQLLHYLNRSHGGGYDLQPVYDVWSRELVKVRQAHPWGMDFPYFIAAANACNPTYAKAFMDLGMSVSEIQEALLRIEGNDKNVYTTEKMLGYAGKNG